MNSARTHGTTASRAPHQRNAAPRLSIAYVAPDMHERACRAVAVASRGITPAPSTVRYARSASAQPNCVERVLRLIDQLAALGAPAADLHAIDHEIAAYIDARAPRRPLLALLTDGQAAENNENLAEVAALTNLRNARALREMAKAKRAEALLDLEIARVAEHEANRLQGEA